VAELFIIIIITAAEDAYGKKVVKPESICKGESTVYVHPQMRTQFASYNYKIQNEK
jgi:hypothetical protein